MNEQVQSLKNLIVRLIDQNETREEGAKLQLREIQALRQEVAEMTYAAMLVHLTYSSAVLMA